MGIGSRSLGQNSWPDFVLDDHDEGYELKGLEVPGRSRDFDANSRLPKGQADGREIYYVFGRYPRGAVRAKGPLTDMVVCHGSFLSRDGQLIHKNTSVKGGGTYGDVLLRVRKMFVPPTPFRSVLGTIGTRTLIVPDNVAVGLDGDARLQRVGQLDRVEASERITGVAIDLSAPGMTVNTAPSDGAGAVHRFMAYRTLVQPPTPVSLSEGPSRWLVSFTAWRSRLFHDRLGRMLVGAVTSSGAVDDAGYGGAAGRSAR